MSRHDPNVGLLGPVLQIAAEEMDEGFVSLGSAKDVRGFVGSLGKLRVWGREPNVKMK